MADPSYDMPGEIHKFPIVVAGRRGDQVPPIRPVQNARPLADPLGPIVPFHAMTAQVATERGIIRDAPRHLKKVSQTI